MAFAPSSKRNGTSISESFSACRGNFEVSRHFSNNRPWPEFKAEWNIDSATIDRTSGRQQLTHCYVPRLESNLYSSRRLPAQVLLNDPARRFPALVQRGSEPLPAVFQRHGRSSAQFRITHIHAREHSQNVSIHHVDLRISLRTPIHQPVFYRNRQCVLYHQRGAGRSPVASTYEAWIDPIQWLRRTLKSDDLATRFEVFLKDLHRIFYRVVHSPLP